MAREAGAFALRRVAGTHADLRLVERNTHAPRHVGHAGQRRAQIPLHVHGQRLQRRHINDAATAPIFSRRIPAPVFLVPWSLGLCRGPRRAICARWGSLLPFFQHQPVQAPQKRGQRLAGAGWRQDQRVLSARNHRPAQALRRCGRVKDRLEPRRRHRVKAGERIGAGRDLRTGFGFLFRHAFLRVAQEGWRTQSEKQRAR